MKPVFSSGSRGFRVLSASADRRSQLLENRPGVSTAMQLEELVELLPEEGGPGPAVMELATGKERTIDGFARDGELLLGHPKTREAMRAGLAMYFETLDDPALMDTARTLVRELRISHFFNIQLVGECVIEINPRISTIVYQEDLNLPYLGVKHALGELSDDEARALAARIRPTRTRAPVLRPGRMGRMSLAAGSASWPAIPSPHPPVTGAGRRAEGTRASAHGTAPTSCRSVNDARHPRRPPAPRRPLPGQHRRDPVAEHARAAPPRRRRAARRLQPDEAPPGRGRRPRPARRRRFVRKQVDPVARARPAPPAHRRLPLLLRPHPRAEVPAVPALAGVPEEVRLPLPRLGHPRQDTGAARLRQARRRPGRRLLRRDPLGAGGARHPARARPPGAPRGAAVRPRAPARRPRALEPGQEGDGARHRGLPRSSTSTSTSSRASRTRRRSAASPRPTSSSTS